MWPFLCFFFFFNDTATTEIYTLSLHDALPISHATAGDMSPQNLTQAVQTYATTSTGSITPRTHKQIESFFDGLELQEPGVVPVALWRPAGIPPATSSGPSFLGGIARKR